MDLLTSVAASLLPLARSRAASSLKAHRAAAAPLEAVLAEAGYGPTTARRAINSLRSEAARLIESGRTAGIEPVAWNDPRYPALLDCIPDPPPVLWLRGPLAALTRPCVAIVGSRAATEYARQVAERLSFELARRGVVVVSGLARGVDAAAHLGCLRGGGTTVAVLGSGVDRLYPAEHRSMAANICEHGLLLSELGPGAPPLPEHFPLRNRIISGISLAVVVVEASDRSGSLITARCGLEQGRDVMAVPGSVLSGRNAGSHRLLKDGAKVVETADDILEELGWPGAAPTSRERPAETDPLLSRMDPGEVYRLDELMARTGMSGPKLLPRLLELELQGRVVTTPAGGFCHAQPARDGGQGLLT
jgi:DNA processing protein